MWCARGDTFPCMVDKRLSEELTERIGEALRNSPAQDVERNVRALLAAWLDRLDLVLREDFEVQKKLLERAQAKLADLERRTTALGILAASGQLAVDALAGHEFAGELSLTGELRAVRGALAMALSARGAGRAFVLPEGNAPQAALADGARILPARTLLEVVAHLASEAPLAVYAEAARATPPAYADFADVKGQQQVKRALEVAAAGGHSVLMVGPPGTGKSMLAARFPGILPPLSEAEALEVAAIHSVSSKGFEVVNWGERPFRAPHHSASAAALVGGGNLPRPGEISLAHHGVLFLDELPEFDRDVLEALREPLESGRVSIARAARQAQFPARFQLVAAMNPCPCGHCGDRNARKGRGS